MGKIFRKIGILSGLILLLVVSTLGICDAASKPKLNITSKTIYTKQTCQLSLKNTKKNVTWSSSDKKVAKVSSKGIVTGVKKGSATIVAKCAGKKYECQITVKKPYLNQTKASLEVGKTLTLKLTGATVSKYESSALAVADVSSKGVVTALKSGSTVITVTDTKKRTYQCSVTVTVPSGGLTQNSMEVNGKTLKYWLYTPKSINGNMPLIVYLHGGGGKGDDLNNLTKSEGFPQYLSEGKLEVPAYVIMLQASADVTAWEELDSEVMALTDAIVSGYPIDKTNISLTGHSMGGIGTWMIGCNHQDVFAKIAPLSGNVNKRLTNDPSKITLPVWSFAGTGKTDENAYNGNTAFFPELTKYNEKAKLTILEGAEHKDVVHAYLEYNVIGWLIGNE